MSNAVIIPAERLNTLRQRRGMVTYSWRNCVLCSRSFRVAGTLQCVCDTCRKATAHLDFGR